MPQLWEEPSLAADALPECIRHALIEHLREFVGFETEGIGALPGEVIAPAAGDGLVGFGPENGPRGNGGGDEGGRRGQAGAELLEHRTRGHVSR